MSSGELLRKPGFLYDSDGGGSGIISPALKILELLAEHPDVAAAVVEDLSSGGRSESGSAGAAARLALQEKGNEGMAILAKSAVRATKGKVQKA